MSPITLYVSHGWFGPAEPMTGPIAIVAAGELFGGAERHILGLAPFLRDHGLDPRVILFYDGELAKRCREDNLPVEILNLHSAMDLEGPRLLGQILARNSIRLVHAHGYKAAVNTALARGQFGMICTLHGQGEPNYRQPLINLKNKLYRNLEIWACRKRRAFVCFVTEDLMHRHGSRYGCLPQATVHNGIAPLNPECFHERPDGLSEGILQALMVGRLTPVKGIDIALAALARLSSGHTWHLNIIGDGRIRSGLQTQTAALGLQDRVTFHGFRNDIFSFMAHSDLLVMSSLHEGLPYTLLEAMSLGLPILASDVGGLAEVLRHEETGLLVPVGDVDGFAVGFDRLGDDSELRRRLGENAARKQRQCFTLEAMGEGYLETYAAVEGRSQ